MSSLTDRLSLIVDEKFNGKWARLGDACGLSRSSLQAIKEGSAPRWDTISRICEACEISSDWLMTGIGSRYRSSEETDRGKSVGRDRLREIAVALDSALRSEGLVIQDAGNKQVIPSVIHDSAQLSGQTFVFGPEKRVVRRTSRDFKAGAEPSTGESYRFKNVGVSMTPELHEFAKIIAEQHDMPFKAYARAALRYAMRHGMNPHEELESQLKISLMDEETRSR